jgi:hypothetical protein
MSRRSRSDRSLLNAATRDLRHAPKVAEIPAPVADFDDELVVSGPDDADDIIDGLFDASEGIDALREIDCDDEEQDR